MEPGILPQRRLEPAVPKGGVPGGTSADAQADDHDPQADASTDIGSCVPHVPRLRRRRRPVPPVDVVPRQRRLPGLSGLRVFRPQRLVLRHDRHTAADVSPRHDAAHGRRRVPRVPRLRGQRRLPRDVLLPRQRRLPGLPRLLLLRPARRVLRPAVTYDFFFLPLINLSYTTKNITSWNKPRSPSPRTTRPSPSHRTCAPPPKTRFPDPNSEQ